MTANQQLNFLQEKIQELGSAIFFNLSDSVLKLPTSIVNTLRVDEYGYVWFFVKKQRQEVKEYEPEFPVRLDFFKKGASYYLQVSGKAWVVTDPEMINEFTVVPEDNHPLDATDMVLVKVKMLKAEYQETQTTGKTSWWQNAVHSVYAWFKNSDNNYYPAS